MCRKQFTLGAVLAAAGVGILLGFFIASGVLQFFLAIGLILGGVILLLR